MNKTFMEQFIAGKGPIDPKTFRSDTELCLVKASSVPRILIRSRFFRMFRSLLKRHV